MSSSPPLNRYNAPLINPKIEENKKRDWIKIAAIVGAVIGGLIVGLGLLCMNGTFPPELIGGSVGIGITIPVGGLILLPSAYTIWKRW